VFMVSPDRTEGDRTMKTVDFHAYAYFIGSWRAME
jgi:hypothetical protein